MTDSEDISSREENYVGKLLALTEPRYAIYQLKDGEELRDYRFTNSEYMQAHGMYADRENYNQVYRGRMQENETLEDIFAKFNVNRPEDFHGHSLSVSDIICVKQNGKITAHFVDSVGFKEVPDFTLSREERKVRRTLTDNLTLLADNQLASDEKHSQRHLSLKTEKSTLIFPHNHKNAVSRFYYERSYNNFISCNYNTGIPHSPSEKRNYQARYCR